MSRHLTAVALAQTALAALLYAGQAVAQDPGPIRIGFTAALTGPYNEFGEGLRRGITIAVEEWNKKDGVNGRKVELAEPLDDQLVPDRAVQNMRRILDDKNIHVIVGPSGSGPSLAIVDMVASDGRPLCNPQAQTPTIVYPNGRENPPRKNIFSVSISNTVEAEKLGQVLAKTYKSVGVLHESTGYGVTGADLIKKDITAQGSTKVTTESYNQRAQDMTAQLVRLQRAGVDALLVIGLGADFAVIRKNMVRLKIELPLFGSAGATTVPYFEGAGDLAVGTIGVGVLSYGERPIAPEAKKFADLYFAKFGADRWYGSSADNPQISLSTVAFGYDCANVLLDGVRRAKSTNPDQVIKALDETKDLVGVGVRSISFTQSDHAALKPTDLGVYRVTKSGERLVFELLSN